VIWAHQVTCRVGEFWTEIPSGRGLGVEILKVMDLELNVGGL
jgi:hypothetical protein